MSSDEDQPQCPAVKRRRRLFDESGCSYTAVVKHSTPNDSIVRDFPDDITPVDVPWSPSSFDQDPEDPPSVQPSDLEDLTPTNTSLEQRGHQSSPSSSTNDQEPEDPLYPEHIRHLAPSEVERYTGPGCYRSNQCRTTNLRRMWVKNDDPSTELLREMDRVAAALVSELNRIKFPTHRIIRFPRVIPEFPVVPGAEELRVLNRTTFIATVTTLAPNLQYLLECHENSRLRIVNLSVIEIKEGVRCLRLIDQTLNYTNLRQQFRRDVLDHIGDRVNLSQRCITELELACLLIDMFKDELQNFEYPHAEPIDAPDYSQRQVASLKRDITAANHGLDRDVWLAVPSLRRLESHSLIFNTDCVSGQKNVLKMPKTAWEETSRAIKTNPDWNESLDSLSVPPMLGTRRCQPLFPRMQNDEGDLEVPQPSSDYSEAAVTALISTFGIDTENKTMEILQRSDAVEACRLLVAAVHLGDAIFDIPLPALPFRCLDEEHALQYLCAGRPCLMLATPISEGLYGLRANKTGISNKNLMRSVIGSATNTYLPIDMLRFDRRVKAKRPGQPICHGVYLVTVTYDRSHDIPETFMRATRDMVRIRNGLYEASGKWKAEGLVLLLDVGAFEAHYITTDRMKQVTSNGPRPFVKTVGCPCRCKNPCPSPCDICLCEKAASSDPLVRLGHQVTRSSLTGACHLHMMLYCCSLTAKTVPNTTTIRNALHFRSPHLNIKEVCYGDPSSNTTSKSRRGRPGFQPELSSSGEKMFPLARTMLYLLKDMNQGIILRLLRAFGDPKEEFSVSIHVHVPDFVPSLAYMLAAGLRARIVLSFPGSEAYKTMLQHIARNESDKQISQRLSTLFKGDTLADGAIEDARSSALSKSERRRMDARVRLATAAFKAKEVAPEGNLFTSPTKLLNAERIRPNAEADASIQALTATDSKIVRGMVERMHDESLETLPESENPEYEILLMLLRGMCIYKPSRSSLVLPTDNYGQSVAIDYLPDIFRVPTLCDPDIIHIHLYDRETQLCKLLLHLSIYLDDRYPQFTQVKQIYILASGSGKTTLGECLQQTFDNRCFTPSREATKHFTMMQFCKKRANAVWLDDEWTPEKYKGFMATDFNKIVEGNMNARVPNKGSSAIQCRYQGWTLLMSNYAPYAMLTELTAGVVSQELRRRFVVYGLQPILDADVNPAFRTTHIRPLLRQIREGLEPCDIIRCIMTNTLTEDIRRHVWKCIDDVM